MNTLPNCYRCEKQVSPRGKCACRDGICLIHADCREVLPLLEAGCVDLVLTDPIWPDTKVALAGSENPWALLNGVLLQLPAGVKRLAIQLGMDSDPRFLTAVSTAWPYFGLWFLEYTRPHYRGRLLYKADIGYLFGEPPPSRNGNRVIGGRYLDTSSCGKESDHPCPRKLRHVVRLLTSWSAEGELVLDPFAGSGTTGRASKDLGRRCLMIEIEEKYCEIAAQRLRQEVFAL